MSRRHENKRAARNASTLRWWLNHYAGCVMCSMLDTPAGRLGCARDEIDDYRANTPRIFRRTVRVPRRFWPILGRLVKP
jgi:hypothetical protein